MNQPGIYRKRRFYLGSANPGLEIFKPGVVLGRYGGGLFQDKSVCQFIVVNFENFSRSNENDYNLK